MSNKTNRRTPDMGRKINILADRVNTKDIEPKFFVPKTEVSGNLISCFQTSADQRNNPMISYDKETRLFFLHNVETDQHVTQDDCMNLILHFQLAPVFYNGLYFYKPMDNFQILSRYNFNCQMVPDAIKEYGKKCNFKIMITANTRKKMRKIYE